MTHSREKIPVTRQQESHKPVGPTSQWGLYIIKHYLCADPRYYPGGHEITAHEVTKALSQAQPDIAGHWKAWEVGIALALHISEDDSFVDKKLGDTENEERATLTIVPFNLPLPEQLLREEEASRLDHKVPADTNLRLVGRRIAKKFGKRKFFGKVLSVRWLPEGAPGTGRGQFTYWVKYSDGDVEEMFEEELLELLLPEKKKKDAKKAKAETATASDEDLEYMQSIMRFTAPERTSHDNPLGGVCRDLPNFSPPPLADGEMEVLSHVLSPEVTALFLKAQQERAKSRTTERHENWAQILSPIDVGDEFEALGGVDIQKQLSRRINAAFNADAAESIPVETEAPALCRSLPYSAAVEMYTVPEDDTRCLLRGQLGVRCRAGFRIPPRTLLGPYAAYVCTASEQDVRKFLPPTGAEVRDAGAGESGGASDHQLIKSIERLEEEGKHLQFQTNFVRIKGTVVADKRLVVDAYGYGGLAAAVNDGAINPYNQSDDSAQGSEPNVALVEVLVHGFPFMMHMSLREINGGEELLCRYGEDYWDAHDDHQCRVKDMRRSLQQEQEQLSARLTNTSGESAWEVVAPPLLSPLASGKWNIKGGDGPRPNLKGEPGHGPAAARKKEIIDLSLDDDDENVVCVSDSPSPPRAVSAVKEGERTRSPSPLPATRKSTPPSTGAPPPTPHVVCVSDSPSPLRAVSAVKEGGRTRSPSPLPATRKSTPPPTGAPPPTPASASLPLLPADARPPDNHSSLEEPSAKKSPVVVRKTVTVTENDTLKLSGLTATGVSAKRVEEARRRRKENPASAKKASRAELTRQQPLSIAEVKEAGIRAKRARLATIGVSSVNKRPRHEIMIAGTAGDGNGGSRHGNSSSPMTTGHPCTSPRMIAGTAGDGDGGGRHGNSSSPMTTGHPCTSPRKASTEAWAVNDKERTAEMCTPEGRMSPTLREVPPPPPIALREVPTPPSPLGEVPPSPASVRKVPMREVPPFLPLRESDSAVSPAPVGTYEAKNPIEFLKQVFGPSGPLEAFRREHPEPAPALKRPDRGRWVGRSEECGVSGDPRRRGDCR